MRTFRTIILGAVFGALFLLPMHGSDARAETQLEAKCKALQAVVVNVLAQIGKNSVQLVEGTADFTEEDLLDSVKFIKGILQDAHDEMERECRGVLPHLTRLSGPQCTRVTAINALSRYTLVAAGRAGFPMEDGAMPEIRDSLIPIQEDVARNYCTSPAPAAPAISAGCFNANYEYHNFTIRIADYEIQHWEKHGTVLSSSERPLSLLYDARDMLWRVSRVACD